MGLEEGCSKTRCLDVCVPCYLGTLREVLLACIDGLIHAFLVDMEAFFLSMGGPSSIVGLVWSWSRREDSKGLTQD